MQCYIWQKKLTWSTEFSLWKAEWWKLLKAGEGVDEGDWLPSRELERSWNDEPGIFTGALAPIIPGNKH